MKTLITKAAVLATIAICSITTASANATALVCNDSVSKKAIFVQFGAGNKANVLGTFGKAHGSFTKGKHADGTRLAGYDKIAVNAKYTSNLEAFDVSVFLSGVKYGANDPWKGFGYGLVVAKNPANGEVKSQTDLFLSCKQIAKTAQLAMGNNTCKIPSGMGCSSHNRLCCTCDGPVMVCQ